MIGRGANSSFYLLETERSLRAPEKRTVMHWESDTKSGV